MSDCEIFFVGAGRMAQAIAAGLVRGGVSPARIVAADVDKAAAAAFEEVSGARAFLRDWETEWEHASTVVLAVKPQYFSEAVKGKSFAGKRVVSIMAGITLRQLRGATGHDRIVRAMPNVAALVGEGCAAYAALTDDIDDVAAAERILGAVGSVYRVEEKHLDAVTALSGSGPAYVFDFIMALADGGVAEGLPRELAQKMAIDTVRGAAALAGRPGAHPALLREQVASPGGTTIRGLAALECGAFRHTVMEAVRQAALRARELAGEGK